MIFVNARRSLFPMPIVQIDKNEQMVHITHVSISLRNDGQTRFTNITGIIDAITPTGTILYITFFINSIIGQPISPFIIYTRVNKTAI